MASATEGDHSATYGYMANSNLVGQVVFNHAGSTIMTTSKAYDNLNRLTAIANVLASGSTVASTSYTYNAANERTEAKLADGGYWKYDYDTLGQVTGGSRRLSDGTRLAGLTAAALTGSPGSEPLKVAIARVIWENTSVDLNWIAERLTMKTQPTASQQIRRSRLGEPRHRLPTPLTKWITLSENAG